MPNWLSCDLQPTHDGRDNSIFPNSMLRGSLSHSILTYPPCITDVYILMFPMLLAWLHFIIGIVGGGLLIQLATVYVIYIDCICWRWYRICCTLLVVVISGRGSIWENWKITSVEKSHVCCSNKLELIYPHITQNSELRIPQICF